jgi:hypothetical protein
MEKWNVSSTPSTILLDMIGMNLLFLLHYILFVFIFIWTDLVLLRYFCFYFVVFRIFDFFDEGKNDVCSEAARGGQLELLIYARQLGFEWNFATIKNAAAEGHLEVILLLRHS